MHLSERRTDRRTDRGESGPSLTNVQTTVHQYDNEQVVWTLGGRSRNGEPGLSCCFPDDLGAGRLFRLSSTLAAKGSHLWKTPGVLRPSPLFPPSPHLSRSVYLCVGALAPIALRFGHAGHEEYPALTWHIRSDDRDTLAAHSGRGYYKKEGKRETAERGGGSLGERGRKREGTAVTIYGQEWPLWGIAPSFAAFRPILTCTRQPLSSQKRPGRCGPSSGFCRSASGSGSWSRRLFNFSLLSLLLCVLLSTTRCWVLTPGCHLISLLEKRKKKIRQEVGPSGMERKNIEKILRGWDEGKKMTALRKIGWDEVWSSEPKWGGGLSPAALFSGGASSGPPGL